MDTVQLLQTMRRLATDLVISFNNEPARAREAQSILNEVERLQRAVRVKK